VLLAVDLYEDFIDAESVTVTTMLSLHSPGVYSSEFDAPEAEFCGIYTSSWADFT
jgi:hypothetical protein